MEFEHNQLGGRLHIDEIFSFYDRPVLFSAKNILGQYFIILWADENEQNENWLLVAVSSSRLQQTRTGGFSLRDVFLKSETTFIFQAVFSNGYLNELDTVACDKINLGLLPQPNQFIKLSKIQQRNTMVNNEFRLNIAGNWSMLDFQTFMKYFTQIYSFFSTMNILQNQLSGHQRIDYLLRRQPWRGGFSSVNFFAASSDLLAPEQKPQVKEIRYASPGWIDLGVNLSSAFLVQDYLVRVRSNSDEISNYYIQSHRFLRDHDLLSNNYSNEELDKKNLSNEVMSLYVKFSELLGFEFQELILSRTESNLIAIKTIFAFYRRLRELESFVNEQKFLVD